jgi:hypothetical protein
LTICACTAGFTRTYIVIRSERLAFIALDMGKEHATPSAENERDSWHKQGPQHSGSALPQRQRRGCSRLWLTSPLLFELAPDPIGDRYQLRTHAL